MEITPIHTSPLPQKTLAHRRRSVAALLILPLGWLLHGCAPFRPAPASYQPHLDRVEVKVDGPMRVSSAVLSDQEAKTMFGLPLGKKQIQPVWVRIENSGSNRYLFLPASVDPGYFSPSEVAYKFRRSGAHKRNARVQAFMESKGIQLVIPEGGNIEGFIFTNHDPGMKRVIVETIGESDHRELEFHLSVPGQRFDFHRVEFEKLYAPEDYRDYSLEELLAVLEALPAATTDKKGTGDGDPINLVVVTDENDRIGPAFSRQGWDPTETLTSGNAFKLIGAFLFHTTWRTSPVSPLYLFGRPQDIALQKARRTIHERNHLRLWLAPFTCEGRHVLVGQISRDIGIRFTTRAPGGVTHKIDPDTDEARDYLVQEMLSSGSVRQIAFVHGVTPAPREQPQQNLTGDPWYTDGLRAVLFLSDQRVSPTSVHFLGWHERTRPDTKLAGP